jgi:hypothetical protein
VLEGAYRTLSLWAKNAVDDKQAHPRARRRDEPGVEQALELADLRPCMATVQDGWCARRRSMDCERQKDQRKQRCGSTNDMHLRNALLR